jgi:hypothetical protein
MSPIPVIVIGKMPQIATAVRKGLAPEYDGRTVAHTFPFSTSRPQLTSKLSTVIHIIAELEQALQDLPLLLSSPSKTPSNTALNLGSQNYGTRPRIVAIGGGHSEENFGKMRDACKSVDKGIIWVNDPHLLLYQSRSNSTIAQKTSPQGSKQARAR